MEGTLFVCPAGWRKMLPPGIGAGEDLAGRRWDLLALTRQGCREIGPESGLRCRILLAPGDCPREVIAGIRAESVVSWGMSSRDSLTLSSLTQPVLCVQRQLPRPDGGVIEPQEFPLPPLPEGPEELLPLLGTWLLQMPLTEEGLCDMV